MKIFTRSTTENCWQSMKHKVDLFVKKKCEVENGNEDENLLI